MLTCEQTCFCAIAKLKISISRSSVGIHLFPSPSLHSLPRTYTHIPSTRCTICPPIKLQHRTQDTGCIQHTCIHACMHLVTAEKDIPQPKSRAGSYICTHPIAIDLSTPQGLSLSLSLSQWQKRTNEKGDSHRKITQLVRWYNTIRPLTKKGMACMHCNAGCRLRR